MSSDDQIKASYRKQGYSEFDPIVLHETEMTQLIFKPGVHNAKGARG